LTSNVLYNDSKSESEEEQEIIKPSGTQKIEEEVNEFD